jgi:hypothetical protein
LFLKTNESWGDDEGYYKQDNNKLFVGNIGNSVESSMNNGSNASNLDSQTPDAPLHIPPEISPTVSQNLFFLSHPLKITINMIMAVKGLFTLHFA